MAFKIVIITPEAKLFEGEANELTAPGLNGKFGILANHAPMVAGLGEGNVSLKTDSGDKAFNVEGGFLEVTNNVVSIMADKATEA